MTTRDSGSAVLDPAVAELYGAFRSTGLAPLWTQTSDLMPTTARSPAVPCRWAWADVRVHLGPHRRERVCTRATDCAQDLPSG